MIDKYELHLALSMRANWIETTDVYMSGNDAVNCGQAERARPLSAVRLDLVARLRAAAAAALSDSFSLRPPPVGKEL